MVHGHRTSNSDCKILKEGSVPQSCFVWSVVSQCHYLSGVLSPSVITILNLLKCLSNCRYHSPHCKLKLFFSFTLNSSNNSLPPLHCIVLLPFLTQMCIYFCVPLSFHCISFSIFFIMCIRGVLEK